MQSKMSQPFRDLDGHLCFPISSKNVNFVENVELLFPIKFRQIPFNGFGHVENVKFTTNRRRTTPDHNSEP